MTHSHEPADAGNTLPECQRCLIEESEVRRSWSEWLDRHDATTRRAERQRIAAKLEVNAYAVEIVGSSVGDPHKQIGLASVAITLTEVASSLRDGGL